AIAVVVPSITYEVFPLVLLEAFAAGTPVIARNLGPLAEIVNESHGGLLFNNAAELKSRLRELQTDSRLRDKLGEQGQSAWRERWTLDIHLREYLSLIDELRAQRSLPETGSAA